MTRGPADYERCVACGTRVPDGEGVVHADLGVRSHQGACADIVDGLRRVYDRSKRGRWRPRAEVLRLLAEQRKKEGGHAVSQ